MAAVRGESAEGNVTHLRLPPELEEDIKELATLEGRTFTGQIMYMLDEAVNGPRKLRLMRGRLRKN
jgi:hypothetical protein